MADHVTVIGRATRVRGRVTGSEDVEVRGFVDGGIAVAGDVTVDGEGMVGAGIQGRRIVVRGAVRGDLAGAESVVLEEGARVVGDVRAPRVAIAPGALVRGYVETGSSGRDGAPLVRATQAATRPAATAPRAAALPPVRATAPKPLQAIAQPEPHVASVPAPPAEPPPIAVNHLGHGGGPSGGGPRRPPPPVVPALKKAKGQIVKKKER